MKTIYFSTAVILMLFAFVFPFILYSISRAKEKRRMIELDNEKENRFLKRKFTHARLKNLSAFDFPCGAKAVKFTRLEADKATTANFEFKHKSIREGDVFLYGCDMCEERSRCALAKCPYDPHRRRLLLKAVSETVGKTDAEDGHEVGTKVLDDNLRVPAFSMVDVILKIKGFVFNSDGDIVVSLPPFADLVDRADNGNDQHDGAVPCRQDVQ